MRDSIEKIFLIHKMINSKKTYINFYTKNGHIYDSHIGVINVFFLVSMKYLMNQKCDNIMRILHTQNHDL